MKLAVCKNCNKDFKYGTSKTGTYCSLECTFDDKRKERKQNFLEGKITTRKSIKKYLVEEHGNKCSLCNISEWMGQEIIVEVDHIDGDASNNSPDNVRLLCPNCHSLTPTHRAKNKGNGRKSKGLPYW